jgi:NAD-dependent dihydropyrimidine dehydrogenase PreA subunit
MSCGCCLEACPQFNLEADKAAWDTSFIGAHAISQARLFNEHATGAILKDERLDALMGQGGINDCGNAQNCVKVCPKHIPLTESIAAMGLRASPSTASRSSSAGSERKLVARPGANQLVAQVRLPGFAGKPWAQDGKHARCHRATRVVSREVIATPLRKPALGANQLVAQVRCPALRASPGQDGKHADAIVQRGLPVARSIATPLRSPLWANQPGSPGAAARLCGRALGTRSAR